ncbi:hypothetical protein OIU76_023949 [Salix suchowensis]|nr:hypothetical protein OIU76_023949 [Salix suchowensis]
MTTVLNLQTRMREKRGTHAKEQRKQGKVAAKPPKAIDEDLYKISPELLRSSKRTPCEDEAARKFGLARDGPSTTYLAKC